MWIICWWRTQFFGAIPDGVIENHDCIVEKTCPSSYKDLHPDEATLKWKFAFWKVNEDKSAVTEINQKHQYFLSDTGTVICNKKNALSFRILATKGMKVSKVNFVENKLKFWLSFGRINRSLPHENGDKKRVKMYFRCSGRIQKENEI